MRVLICCVLLFGIFAAAQTSDRPTAGQSANKSSETSQSNGSDANIDELNALKQDAQHMRTILEQMRNNLGFVGSTTTPANHQFELEIEMWQVVLNHMERRIERMRRQAERTSGDTH